MLSTNSRGTKCYRRGRPTTLRDHIVSAATIDIWDILSSITQIHSKANEIVTIHGILLEQLTEEIKMFPELLAIWCVLGYTMAYAC